MTINEQDSLRTAPSPVSDTALRVANEANKASDSAKSAASDTARSVSEGLDTLRDSGISALSRAAAKAEEVSRIGVEQAWRAGAVVSEKAKVTGDRTVAYIRQEPVKAVLMAAGAGALLALLLGRREYARYGRD